jgi:hypothetical protein
LAFHSIHIVDAKVKATNSNGQVKGTRPLMILMKVKSLRD